MEFAVKLVGAALLVAVAVMYGRMKILEERHKVALISGMEGLVLAIRDGIAHYKKPLGEIYSSFSSDVLEENGFLPRCRVDGIRAAWERTNMNLPPKMMELMNSFTVQIGSGYTEDELRLCGHTLEQIGRISAEALEEKNNREKLYINIPPLAALSAVLLFL